jgi:hypothetical protein
MTTYTVVTTFHQPGLALYAQNMLDAFDRHWPRSVALVAYAEDCVPRLASNRITVLDLHQCCPNLVSFKNRHRDNPVANGKVMKDTNVPYRDNHFKWDAVRFSNKVFAVIHAVRHIDTDWVIWLDADTKTFADVPEHFLDSVCDPSAMACYLGRREKYHSECGWVAYNRRHPDCQSFVDQWEQLHLNDSLFDLREYHDSFVFDVLRKQFQQRGVRFHSISPELPGKGPGHPFIASRLGEYMDHMKGTRRKSLGHSLPDDYQRNQGLNSAVPYWRGIFGR